MAKASACHRHWSLNLLKTCIFVSFSTLFLVKNVESLCTAGKFNLTALQQWDTWLVKNTPGTFYLNLCEDVSSSVTQGSCSSGVSACLSQGDTLLNVGSHNDTLQPAVNEHAGGFRLDYRGGQCNATEKWQTTINFECGTTLGAPNFLGMSDCTYFLEWDSMVACSSVRDPALMEVPCSVYDSQGKRRDLSPLVKLKGGYLVESPDADDLYINVCRDITAEDSGATLGCPPGSGACLVKKGTSENMGAPHQKLKLLSDDELQLHYEVSSSGGGVVPAECNGFTPSVTIIFVCPREEGRYTGNRGPILLSSTNCQYQVQWQTEYACEVDMLTTSTCAFNSDTHGLNFDLSPLTKTGHEDRYVVSNAGDYIYYINVCADITGFSNCRGAAVGQVSPSNGDNTCTAAGRNEGHELRYTDGELTLIYKNGDVCNHNKFKRTSVISFHCNKTEDPGSPVYVSETDCTYFFDWHTKYACIEGAQSSCRLDRGSKRYDLSPLIRETGSNWLVLDGRHDHSEAVGTEYFINVCAPLTRTDPATSSCPGNASACVVETNQDHSKTGRDIGKFTTSPSFRAGQIAMTYTDGEECTGETCITTDITFLCSPGDLESAPILVRKSDDSLHYDLEWHTAAACPLASKWGTDCKVFDDDIGLSFDLSPLSKQDFYNLTDGKYNYFISVCADLKGTPCNDAGSQDQTPHPASCQGRLDGSGSSYILGQTNTSLGYFDGIIKLTYLHGTPYHSKDGSPGQARMTEIAFLCDPKEDPGTPEFFQENNATYFFRWYTKYACPDEPIECVVTDETSREQYDLSSLSKALEEENWSFVDDSDPTDRKKYYINVCRPVNPFMQCGAFAGVCQTGFQDNKESVLISNLGIPRSPPTIESSGHLLLKYQGGNPCGENKTITSHVHLTCNKGTLASTPRLLEVVDPCTYSFMWETEAACPIDVSEGENCTVRDQNSEYVFNLNPLTKKAGYDVTDSGTGTSYKLNVCGGVPACQGSPGACSVGSEPISLGRSSASLVFSDEGLLTLEYVGGKFVDQKGVHHTTVISFLCRRNASTTDGHPVFVRNELEGTRHLFNFETPLACQPESVDCLVSDSRGNQYDLSPLAKDSGNWEAVDTSSAHSTLSYHINVCRPINKGDPATSSCPGGPIGACQTTSDGPNSESFNMGYVQAMPEAGTDGSLSLRYVNGDICSGKYHRSTRINFECSVTPGSPVFQTKSSECEYIFSWETPAACPLERVTGGNCSVQVSDFGFEYNLSSLYNATHDYTVTTPDYEYTINVCGPLVSKSGDCDKVGVGGCQKNAGNYKNAGLFNKKLTYDDGLLKLNYTGGTPCHQNTFERSTAINFYCDENVKGKGEPHYIKETSDCTYLFEWATPLACPPFKVVECSYRDSENQYDLAPLTRLTDNYRVQGTGFPGDTFYINMCRSLWHRRGAQGANCSHNAAACMETRDGSGKTSYVSLGEVGQGPTMENGHLVLRYESGDACPDDPSKKRTTVINIQCDMNSVGSEPILDHVDGNCDYHFLWLTNYACNMAATDAPTGDCSTINPISGFRFDFTSLANQDGSYTVTASDSHIYRLNVCAAVKSSGCQGSNIGSCQEELETSGGGRHFNAGIFNKNLFFDDSILFLRYDHGKACHNDAFTRSTVINFVCPHQQDKIGEPVFIAESDDCTYYFSWHTSLACENFIQCSVVNGSETINLSPLINDQGYHLASSLLDDGSVTYINLCRPLNPIPGVTCHPNAAACQVADNNIPMSLGRVTSGPQISSDGKLTITYTQGDTCPQDKTKNISSIITFFCKQGITQGSPTLEGYADCTYQFTWGTNVVCPATAPETDHDCTFFNTALQYTFDFTPLSKTDHSIDITSAKSAKLKLCGNPPGESGKCNGAAVCLQTGKDQYSLGQLATQEISQEGELIKVEYMNGSPCPASKSKKRQTTILLVCDRSAVDTSPTLFSSDLDCHYSFRWLTAAACAPETRPCDIAHEGHVYDLKPLSRITGSFNLKENDKSEFFMNLCQPAYDTPDGCPEEASMCRQRADGHIDVLGMVYTQQINTVVTTRGDDPDIMVTFSEGTAVTDCNDPSDRTPNTLLTYATTNITFQCANKIGSPVFQGTSLVDGKCQFNFLWASKVACREERVEVEMKNKMITDPETNVVLDFTKIIDDGTWPAKGDDRQASGDSYVYFVAMDDLPLEIPGKDSEACKDAAICQTKESDDRFFRDIGTRASRKYYMEDGIVEMEVTKENGCGQDNADHVKSTVIFECESDAGTGNPEFYYESSNCQYHFQWYTSTVCTEGKVVLPGDGEDPSSVNAKHKQASVIILVLMGIILLCIIAIVFHKKERRSLVYWKVRGCCPGAYSKVPVYSYSQLSNGDAEDASEGGGQSRTLFDFGGGGEEDEELLKENRRNPFEFHDDSDDDILPHV